MPLVRILPGSDVEGGSLDLIVNGRPTRFKKSAQGRLVAILLQNADNEVRIEDIDSYVQGKPATQNQRKQWLKNIRSRVRSEWLGLSDSDAERPELEVLESVNDGLVLHACVEFSLPLVRNQSEGT
jgi:hypothetical protein